MMNDTLSKIVIFTAGAAVGSAVTWHILKTRYEKLAKEDAASLREYYSSRDSKQPDAVQEDIQAEEENTTPEQPTAQDVREYAAKLADEGYTDYTDITKEKEATDDVTRPYIITPEEFGDCDYETISLTYYADETLTDDADDPIDDIEMVVGSDSLKHFGEYEEDAVFVRNDELKTDYEILLDTRRYSDVVGVNPYRTEEE